jgi:hypothetical protein
MASELFLYNDLEFSSIGLALFLLKGHVRLDLPGS